MTGEELKEILMTSVPNMGEVYTYRHGDCANFDLSIAFLSRPGDLETIQVLVVKRKDLKREKERERETDRDRDRERC